VHRFGYKGKDFYCEDVAVSKIAAQVGTPFYLYSIGTFLDHYFKLRDAFKDANPSICFSTKANSNLTILKALVNAGSGLDVVSGGELFRAKKVGCDPKKIVFASVGKTADEIAEGVRAGILMFNVETPAELDVINAAASKQKKIQKVAIRLNPDVAPDTHHYITTGSKQTKFGIDIRSAESIFRNAFRWPSLRFAGVHVHIGSQITESKPFIAAIKIALGFIDTVRLAGAPVEYLNIGGGLGIIYAKEEPQTAKEFADAVMPLFARYDLGRGLKLVLEPGRFISGNSGVLVTRVIYEKRTPSKSFVIVDAGMNDLIRPSLYGAYHEILPAVKKRSKTSSISDIVGPVCESGDFIAKDRRIASVGKGDLLVVMSCGAYGFVMSSNYNSRPRVPEIVVKGRKFYVARLRETREDLIRSERIISEVV